LGSTGAAHPRTAWHVVRFCLLAWLTAFGCGPSDRSDAALGGREMHEAAIPALVPYPVPAADGSPGDAAPATDPSPVPGDEPPGALQPESPWCAPYAGLDAAALRERLLTLLSKHKSISYDNARKQMYSVLDNVDGQVRCVYTGEWVKTTGIPLASLMNTEHTWCQSWGADVLPAKSDLHNLFPVLEEANNRRSNYPFGEVVRATWSQGGSTLGTSLSGERVFEPRDPHKGDVSRALFYFSMRYRRPIEDPAEAVLRNWNELDPPDAKEEMRNDGIEVVQQNRNPFVDCPTLVDRLPDF